MTNWYDAVYGDDPSTDNIFGREALIPRSTPLLHEFLTRGGRLSAFAVLVADPNLEKAAQRPLRCESVAVGRELWLSCC